MRESLIARVFSLDRTRRDSGTRRARLGRLLCGCLASPRPLRCGRLPCGCPKRLWTAPAGCRPRLLRERLRACRRVSFLHQCLVNGARASCRWLAPPSTLAGLISSLCAAPRLLRDLSLRGRRKVHPRAARLGEAYGNGLLGGTRTVLALTDMLHLFPNEFARLSRGGLAFSCVLACPFKSSFFRHNTHLCKVLVTGSFPDLRILSRLIHEPQWTKIDVSTPESPREQNF